MQSRTIWVAYFSPAGTTKRVAEVIAEEAGKQGCTARMHNLADPEARDEQVYSILSGDSILFVGSPTYAQHPVPRALDFISGIPQGTGAAAAAFVTYGGVTSGVALHDLGGALHDRGLALLGGIKVLAQHSLLWHAPEPIAKGRPGDADEASIREFVRQVLSKAAAEEPVPLSPDALHYQPESIRQAAAESSLTNLKSMLPPITVDEELCTQCGDCEASCPTENISLSPYPKLGDRCVLCFNCIRVCEPGAVTNPALTMLEPVIQERKEKFQEPEETRYFV